MKLIIAVLITVAITVPAASGAGKASGGTTSAAAVGGSKATGGTTGIGGVTARGGAGGYSGAGGAPGTGGRTAAGGVTIAAGHSGISGTTGTGGHHNARWRHGRLSIGIGIGMMAIPWIWKLSALLPALALLLLSARFAATRPTLKVIPVAGVDAAIEPEWPGATSLTRIKTPDPSSNKVARRLLNEQSS